MTKSRKKALPQGKNITPAKLTIMAAANQKDEQTPEEALCMNRYNDADDCVNYYNDADCGHYYNDSCYGCDTYYGYDCNNCPLVSVYHDTESDYDENQNKPLDCNQDIIRTEQVPVFGKQPTKPNKAKNAFHEWSKDNEDFLGGLYQIIVYGGALLAAPLDLHALLLWYSGQNTGTEAIGFIITMHILTPILVLCTVVLLSAVIYIGINIHTVIQDLRESWPDIYRWIKTELTTNTSKQFNAIKSKIAQMRTRNNIKIK